MLDTIECKECGNDFQPKQKTQMFCNEEHYRTCSNSQCSKLFLVQRRRLNSNQSTCSPKCAAICRKASSKPLEHRTCRECKASFIPEHFNSIYCQKTHQRICENCKTPYNVDNSKLSKETRACSQSCGSALTHTESSKDLRRENNLLNYGVEHHFQRQDVIEKIKAHPAVRETFYGSEGFKATMLTKYGVENGFQLPNAVPARVSKPNLKWQQLLHDSTGLEWDLERYFANVGNIDLYCEQNGVKLAVEISPTATHNSYIHKIACHRRDCKSLPCSEHAKSKDYHQLKTRTLKEQHGIELITIFDWMDESKLLRFISAKLKLLTNRVGARQCELKAITQRDANLFFKEHHLLGSSRMQSRCYGLFYKGELLQVQSYSPRKNKGSWEAKRLATKSGWIVMGGISRATRQFIKDENPEEIVAFTDLNLGYGSGFDSNHNGFEKVELQPPTMCWSKGDKMILQKSAAFQSADRLIGIANDSKTSIYPESYTNEQVFIAEGWLPVWDCGKIKEIWRNNGQ